MAYPRGMRLPRTVILLSLLGTAGCFTPSETMTAPAFEAGALMREVFQASMSGHEALVRRSNPPAETLTVYLEHTAMTRRAFDAAWTGLNAAIGSLGAMSPSQVEGTMKLVTDTIKKVKGN